MSDSVNNATIQFHSWKYWNDYPGRIPGTAGGIDPTTGADIYSAWSFRLFTDVSGSARGVDFGLAHNGSQARFILSSVDSPTYSIFDTTYHHGQTGGAFGITVKGGIITGLPSALSSGSIPIADGSGGLAEDSGLQFNPTTNALTIGVVSLTAAVGASANSASQVVSILRAAASQTANIQEIQNSAGAVQGGFTRNGYQFTRRNSAPGANEAVSAVVQFYD